ncbi:TPA: hypothetical protein N0F65_002531 [Lagenidium giganteum]|uniref:Uncharacterized protein n=1 Tax=Lagenidium giganteum TaxID=4803 RepID=A0AAV2YPD9_9STRA|nr:TPA: hypothetical protein N0F65_002531 [Lagenidium giganteum]
MWNYGDIERLDDYSYTYDLPEVIKQQLLSNPDICRGVRKPENDDGDNMPTTAPVTAKPANNGTDAPTVRPWDQNGDDKHDGKGNHGKHNGKGNNGVDNGKHNGNNANQNDKKDHDGNKHHDNGKHRGHGHHRSNSTTYPVKLDGEYWTWIKTTYEGLVQRFDGNMELVTQQMHVAECLAFNNVFGVREFSDDFVHNFHLTSNRPVCGKQIDYVQTGKVQVVVTTTEFKSQTVEFKSEDVIKVVVDEYKPLAPSQAPLIDPSYVEKAQKEIDSYPTSTPSPKTPCPSSVAPVHTPCPIPASSKPAVVTPCPTPAASKPEEHKMC